VSFKITGDFAKLRQWERQFDQPDKLMSQVSRNMAEEAITLIADGFRTESDPYGSKWPARVGPDEGRALLVKSGDLKGSWHIARVAADAFTVASGVFYAIVHQEGRTIVPRAAKWLRYRMGKQWVRSKRSVIPARPMIPEVSRGLPAKWEQAFIETADLVLSEAFGG
jgi:phage gpG-like protein